MTGFLKRAFSVKLGMMCAQSVHITKSLEMTGFLKKEEKNGFNFI